MISGENWKFQISCAKQNYNNIGIGKRWAKGIVWLSKPLWVSSCELNISISYILRRLAQFLFGTSNVEWNLNFQDIGELQNVKNWICFSRLHQFFKKLSYNRVGQRTQRTWKNYLGPNDWNLGARKSNRSFHAVGLGFFGLGKVSEESDSMVDFKTPFVRESIGPRHRQLCAVWWTSLVKMWKYDDN